MLTQEWLRLETVHMDACLRGAISFAAQRHRHLEAFLTFLRQPVAGDLGALFAGYLVRYEQTWTAYDDVASALFNLAEMGLTVGILANGEESQQPAKLEAVGLGDAFSCVVASSTLNAPKPAAEAFMSACNRIVRKPGDVLYAGDNLQTDALAASRAGLGGVWLNRHRRAVTETPWQTVQSLTDIRALLAFEHQF